MQVLIVEDERSFRESLAAQLGKEDVLAVGVATGEEALEKLRSEHFDVVVTDLRLPGIDGIEVIRSARKNGIETPFLLITAYASVQTAVTALKEGAADYLMKPVRLSDLIHRIRQLHDLEVLRRENKLLKRIVQFETEGIWLPETPEGQQIKELISKVAETDLTVLILGESGTGKGMLARTVHKASNRADRSFVAVNCSAIPEMLIESELFGHVKGAFTGADKTQDGLFVAADGGTLFLDEIGELTIAAQAKLLHAIEEKQIRPVGSNQNRKIDARIIAATNRNLAELVKEGKFRDDLYYRLNIFQIPLPPLREQKETLPEVIKFFLQKIARKNSRQEPSIDHEVWNALCAYDWPGNYREVDNTIERAFLLCDGGHIMLKDLPPEIIEQDKVNLYARPLVDSFKGRVEIYERQLIMQAIRAADGDRRAAAAQLDISLSTLYRKLEESVT